MGVRLSIKMADDPDDMVVEASGFEMRLASDEDVRRFGTQRYNPGAGDYHDKLWNVINRIYGRPPNGVFMNGHPDMSEEALFNNGPVNLRYRGHVVNQVVRPVRCITKAVNAEVLSVESEPDSFASRTYRNQRARRSDADKARGATGEAMFGIELAAEVTNTVSRVETDSLNWGVSTTLSVEVGGDAQGYKVGLEQSVSFGGEHTTEKGNESSVGHSLADQLSVVLYPQDAVMASLMAARGSIRVAIEYENYLEGQALVYFKKPHEGQVYHWLSIDDIIWTLYYKEGVKRAQEKIFTQSTEDLGFVSDGQITLYDADPSPPGKMRAASDDKPDNDKPPAPVKQPGTADLSRVKAGISNKAAGRKG